MSTLVLRYEADPATRLPMLKLPPELQLRLTEKEKQAATELLRKEYHAISHRMAGEWLEFPWKNSAVPYRYLVRLEPNPDDTRAPTVVLEADWPSAFMNAVEKSHLNGSTVIVPRHVAPVKATSMSEPVKLPPLFDWFLERTHKLFQQYSLGNAERRAAEYLLEELRLTSKSPAMFHLLILRGLVAQLRESKTRSKMDQSMLSIAGEALQQLEQERGSLDYQVMEDNSTEPLTRKQKGWFASLWE